MAVCGIVAIYKNPADGKSKAEIIRKSKLYFIGENCMNIKQSCQLKNGWAMKLEIKTPYFPLCICKVDQNRKKHIQYCNTMRSHFVLTILQR